MKTKLLSLLAGASLVALAGAANAGQPIALSNDQMDGVTAGASAIAVAAALTLGTFDSETTAQTTTNVVGHTFAVAESAATALAASTDFKAEAIAQSYSAVSLP